MNKGKRQNIEDKYYDALLSLSENDPTLAQELLNEASIDIKKVTTKSLNHISSYEYQLAKRVGSLQRESLRVQVTEKIEKLYAIVPDLVINLIEHFMPNTKLALRFQGKGNTDNDWLDDTDLPSLFIELSKLENEVIKSN
jgi:hypothetical protein